MAPRTTLLFPRGVLQLAALCPLVIFKKIMIRMDRGHQGVEGVRNVESKWIFVQVNLQKKCIPLVACFKKVVYVNFIQNQTNIDFMLQFCSTLYIFIVLSSSFKKRRLLLSHYKKQTVSKKIVIFLLKFYTNITYLITQNLITVNLKIKELKLELLKSYSKSLICLR